MNTNKFVGFISLISGLISLVLSIYLSQNTTLQIASVITLVISAIIFFLYTSYSKINYLEKQYKQVHSDVQQFKEKIEIYSRLAKLENKAFKEEERK